MTDRERPQSAAPCAACKMLRRRCVEKCVLAPYFPPNNPQKFATAHKVFGASTIVKTIQGLPAEQRADAVNSMVYEASARLRDPVYGCSGTICQLQKQVSDLQSQLAIMEAELLNMRSLQANFVALVSGSIFDSSVEVEPFSLSDGKYTEESDNRYKYLFSSMEPNTLEEWEPLWNWDNK